MIFEYSIDDETNEIIDFHIILKKEGNILGLNKGRSSKNNNYFGTFIKDLNRKLNKILDDKEKVKNKEIIYNRNDDYYDKNIQSIKKTDGEITENKLQIKKNNFLKNTMKIKYIIKKQRQIKIWEIFL